MGNGITATIDTYAFIKKLINAGVSEKQAEIQADTINKAFTDFRDTQREGLATKIDIAALKTDIAEVKTDIAEVKTELADVKAEVKIIKWIGGFIIGLVAAVFIMLLKITLNF